MNKLGSSFKPVHTLLMALLAAAFMAGCGGGSDGDKLFGSGAGVGNGDPGPAGAAPALASAARFGTFGGSAGMTNTGTLTVITGTGGNTADIGTTATGTTSITGFHDSAPSDVYTETGANVGSVTGKIYTCTTSTTGPTSVTPNAASCAIATQALADAQTAFISLSPAARPGGLDVATCPGCGSGGAGELGTRTLAPGVYKSAPGTYDITLGDLTLDAQGNVNAVWVFQMASALTVGIAGPTGARSIILANGAQAKNVFWQVGSQATINGAGGGTMAGTIIASSGVTFSTAGNTTITTLNGRALSLVASVTMVNTVINVPAP
jgi:hypothetical protein